MILRDEDTMEFGRPEGRILEYRLELFNQMDNNEITDIHYGNSDIGEDAPGAAAHHGQQQLPQTKGLQPTLFHRVRNQRSILALVVSDQRIYAGTQGGEILVWSLETYERIFNVAAHRGSVLCLYLSQDGKLLFSSAGDAIVNVWCTETLNRLYSIYSTFDVGDVFSVAYSSDLQTVYLGAQNTSIQWYDLAQKDSRPPLDPTSHPSHRNHRFFDSKGPGGLSTPRPVSSGELRAEGGQVLEIDKDDIMQFAHYGYVYCMLLARGISRDDADAEILISGGGDGTIKLWSLHKHADRAIQEICTLENGDDSVLSMTIDATFLYSGRLEGDINVWDLDTRQLFRSVKAHSADVLTLAATKSLIFSGGSNGYAQKFNKKYECISRWRAHDQLILASAVASYHGRSIYVTGGNDNCVAIWDITDCVHNPAELSPTSDVQLVDSLQRLVSYRTVSSSTQYAEACRGGASFLRKLFKRFGASTEMLNTENRGNPIVYAKFTGKPTEKMKRKRILFYGHYDVIAAENEQGNWKHDPFDLQGLDGYLYGRGVSDNKGPVLAALFAVADLVSEQALTSDIVFLIEGEEERGSRGFAEAVRKNKHIIGDIDWILLANSYWLTDDVPCLTYGLRGVIHATVQVKSGEPDLHSGVDGSGLMDESLKDLVMLLANLTGPHGRVQIPGFYCPILPITEAEDSRYAAITRMLVQSNPNNESPDVRKAKLMARSREPSLTVHRFNVSGPENSTIIPSTAWASISIRLVPNQQVEEVKEALTEFLRLKFRELESKNVLSISIDHQAEPWLGDPNNELFRTLEEAIIAVWGSRSEDEASSETVAPNSNRKLPQTSERVPPPTSTLTNGSNHSSETSGFSIAPGRATAVEANQIPKSSKPLYIREGGSIPAIRFLEKEFNAQAAHLPCGQASDSAHLDNERLRLLNLYKSREIFRKVFRELPKK